MTLAICIKCGSEKFGAFVACKSCGFHPASEEELAKSMMVTDHYFPKEALHEIGNDLSAGKQVEFSSENVAQLVDVVRERHLRKTIGLEQPTTRPSKRPWWKLI